LGPLLRIETTMLVPRSLHDALPIFRLHRPPLFLLFLPDDWRFNLQGGEALFIYKQFSAVISHQEQGIHKDQMQTEYVNLFSEFEDRKSTRLNSSHVKISYAVFCLKK